MYYDPVKEMLGSYFCKNIFLRRFLYRVLDIIIVRTWHMHREIRLWAQEHKSAIHILDAGAGYGQYAYFLHKLNPNYNILGVDTRSEQVCQCNKFYRDRNINKVFFRCGDLTQFKQENAFDFILCVDVMEYIENDQQVFQNFYDALRPNGVFLMSVPSDKPGRYKIHQFKLPDEDAFQRAGYNISDIKVRLKKLGYKKVRARYSYGWPGQLSWFFGIKIPITTLRISKILMVLMPFYFLLVFPICLALNFIDSHMGHLSGSGLLVKAYK